MSYKKIYLFFCLVLMAVVLIMEQYTDIDVWVSNHFYDFDRHRWTVTPALHEILSPIFYEGAKHFVAFIGTLCVLYMFFSLKKKEWRKNFSAVMTVLLCTIIIPTTVGRLKKVTNVYCPNQLDIYEQKYPYVRVTEKYPDNFQPQHKGRCFPGGHVTGAFSLMSLYLIFHRRKNKLLALGGAVCFGFVTGTYQILRGEHFFSHNLISMLIAAFLIVIINETVIRCAAFIQKRQKCRKIVRTMLRKFQALTFSCKYLKFKWKF
ncbi:MAG: phosphatase PAP2 family protein [Alphaproteobacteria bacterium]|nr:phosphatase PAP2 family protein [Alphaproteobacteria bacterium]